MPIALQVARRTEKPASRVLMPLAFGSLLGGLMTLIGTSPNIIVSRMREQITGEPFRMFDFAPVGHRPRGRGRDLPDFRLAAAAEDQDGAGATPETRFSIEDYITEVAPADGFAAMSARRSATWRRSAMAASRSLPIIREGYRRYIPAGYWPLFEGDILVLEADTHALSRLVDDARLELIHGKRLAPGDAPRGRSGGGRGGGDRQLDHDRQHRRAACACASATA